MLAMPRTAAASFTNEGLKAIRYAPHIIIFPSIVLSMTLLAFNFVGDGLREALDPRARR